MRTVLPALAQAVVLNALSNSQDELTAGNLKEKLQVVFILCFSDLY